MSTTSVKDKYEEVLKYYNKVIKGYLINDIQKLLSKEFDDLEYGGCAAPLVMTVFSAMNQLGYLTNKSNSQDISDADVAINSYCNSWMKVINEKYKSKKITKAFAEIYRNGFAHQFLSMYPTAITRSTRITEFIVLQDNHPTLQVKILAEDFLKSIVTLEKKLRSSSSTDPKFINCFYDRLFKQHQHYSSKHQDVIKNLIQHENITKIPVTTDITTRVPKVTQSIETKNTKDA